MDNVANGVRNIVLRSWSVSVPKHATQRKRSIRAAAPCFALLGTHLARLNLALVRFGSFDLLGSQCEEKQRGTCISNDSYLFFSLYSAAAVARKVEARKVLSPFHNVSLFSIFLSFR